MADASYDAVIIGGGNKALITAMYLAKYGGMEVALFESKHEAGGGWCSDEGAAPGFVADYHCTSVGTRYQDVTELDFPEWRELHGGYTRSRAATGSIFKEDDSCIVISHIDDDPTQERSAKSIARFSEKDAEEWVKTTEFLYDVVSPAMLEYRHNPPTPPGEPDALERLLTSSHPGIDPSWAVRTPLEVGRDIFETEALIAHLLRMNYSALRASPDMPGMGFIVVMYAMAQSSGIYGVRGGTHNWAHAAAKIIFANGGRIFTKQEVDKILIENGRAKGIRLTDGTEVEARKLVLSTLDPYNLCFRLIGQEYLDSRTLKRVANLERRISCFTWYGWALHEHPDYKAASSDPDINEATIVMTISKDPEALLREHSMRRSGRMPEELLLLTVNHSLADKSRAPEGKSAIGSEQFVLPANALTEREWLKFKEAHAKNVMGLWQQHTNNMTWDNVIGYVPITPYDVCGLANMAPTGNAAIIDIIPSQMGRNRPIPELSGYKAPIENLYATGSAWHPFAQGGCWQAYNCYKIIAQDFGLRKPWDETGRPW